MTCLTSRSHSIDDPKAYLKPWTAKVPIDLLPDTDLIETFCENEKDLHRMDRTPLPGAGATR